MISAFSSSASSTPTCVLPAAVGPVRYQQSTAGGTGAGPGSKGKSTIAGRETPLYDDSNPTPQIGGRCNGGWSVTRLLLSCESAHVQRLSPAHVGPRGPQDQPAAQFLHGQVVCRWRREDRLQDRRRSARAGRSR